MFNQGVSNPPMRSKQMANCIACRKKTHMQVSVLISVFVWSAPAVPYMMRTAQKESRTAVADPYFNHTNKINKQLCLFTLQGVVLT
jgi:hypothetical protein